MSERSVDAEKLREFGFPEEFIQAALELESEKEGQSKTKLYDYLDDLVKRVMERRRRPSLFRRVIARVFKRGC